MREQESLLRLEVHRERCKRGCPKVGPEFSDIDEFCNEGIRLIQQVIDSEDDA